MNSISICLLLIAGLVSAHEGPVAVVEQPAHSEHVIGSDAQSHQQHHHQNQGSPVQAQPVPVHIVDYAHQPQNVGDVHKNLYMPSSLLNQGESPVQNNKLLQQVGGQVVPLVNNKEQYGAPEPAGLPANYKPFGSWGLYIGGNPPDGYYSNFYKSLDGIQGNQQQHGQAVSSSGQQQPSPLSSYVYKQSGPVGQSDYLQPFVYSADELNSAYPISGQPLSYMPDVSEDHKPHFYAAKGLGSPAHQAREISKTSHFERSSSSSSSGVKGSQQQQQQQVKGHYAFSPVAYGPAVQYAQGHQVLPYSVPVGSQIVGSQPGVDGAFSPYGIHAFTRYAVKPVAGQNQYIQYGVPAPVDHIAPHQQNEQSLYKQRGQYQQFGFYQPATFGYQVGVPNFQNHLSAHSVSSSSVPVSGQVGPLASPVSVESPAVPVASVAAPASPVQVGQQVHASPSGSLDSSLSQQQEQVQQQQVVEQKQVEKSSVKQ